MQQIWTVLNHDGRDHLKVAATAKHFSNYGIENYGDFVSAIVSAARDSRQTAESLSLCRLELRLHVYYFVGERPADSPVDRSCASISGGVRQTHRRSWVFQADPVNGLPHSVPLYPPAGWKPTDDQAAYCTDSSAMS